MSLGARARWQHAMLIALATLALCWPAIWNGYPLLFPDSYDYVVEGRTTLHMLLGHSNEGFAALRPELYTATLFLLHEGRSPWPVILFQGLLTAWVLWLVVRRLVARWTAGWYVAIVLILCALTSIAWNVSYVMPDALGPVAYLAIFVLLSASAGSRRAERWALMATAGWCLCAHPTHLWVAAILCCAISVLWLLRWTTLRDAGASLVALWAMVLVATLLPMLAHVMMYRNTTVNERRPAFLMARLTADGPAREYLREHCDTLQWAVCRYQDKLTSNSDEFLWTRNGAWQSAGVADRAAMLHEELPLLLGVLRSTPAAQLRISAHQALQQMMEFHEFAMLDSASARGAAGLFPHGASTYARSRQGQNLSLPWAFQSMLYGTVEISAIALLAMSLWKWRDGRMALLLVIVIFALLANATVTGVLSEVSWRYQSRVAWLIVLMPLLMAATKLQAHSDFEGPLR